MSELRELIKTYDLREKNNTAAFFVAIIGILTVFNCLFLIFKYKFAFTCGLGILAVFQVVLFELFPSKDIAMASAIVVLVSLATAGGFFYLSWRILQGNIAAYKTVMMIYAIDTLLLFYCSDFIGFIIHGLLLWYLYAGYNAVKKLLHMEATLDKLDELLDEDYKEKEYPEQVIEQVQRT